MIPCEHRKNNSLRPVPLSIIAVSIPDGDGEPVCTHTLILRDKQMLIQNCMQACCVVLLGFGVGSSGLIDWSHGFLVVYLLIKLLVLSKQSSCSPGQGLKLGQHRSYFIPIR